MVEYDYLVVGSGLYGAVFSYEMNKRGFKCLVIEKRDHLGGNVYTRAIEGIQVHCYGAHIFHTDSKKIWDYVNQFATFNRFTNSPLAYCRGNIYNLPFNMNTFNQVWGVRTPQEAEEKISSQLTPLNVGRAKNLEEKALSLIGYDLFEMFIKGYTEKQWGYDCKDLPPEIITRIPIRFDYDNNYFNDQYQGIPIGGYSQIIEKLLNGIECRLNVDFLSDRVHFSSLAKKIVYTGPIDRYFDLNYGKLDYRSLDFENIHLETENFQGNAVVNYCDKDTPYTRIIEHKKFEFGKQSTTIISKEYPMKYDGKNEPYYPITNQRSKNMLTKYQHAAKGLRNVIFGGRLGEFKYYDMHQVIASAWKAVENEIKLKKL